MSRIEVVPTTLTESAERLRATGLDVRRIRELMCDAGPDVTGSAELSAALREHADAWGWFVDKAQERVRDAAGALDAAAGVYVQVEQAVAYAAAL